MTDDAKLKRKSFTESKTSIIRNLAFEKFHRQTIVKKNIALQLFEKFIPLKNNDSPKF